MNKNGLSLSSVIESKRKQLTDLEKKEKDLGNRSDLKEDVKKELLKKISDSKKEIENEIDFFQNKFLKNKKAEEEKEIKNFNKYSLSTGDKNSKLFDLRNIVNEKNENLNFRKSGSSNSNRESISPSRSFLMNKDFLIIDSLALTSYDNLSSPEISNVLYGLRENIENMPSIQPLIINEFQPYDMLSPADLMPGGFFGKVTEGLRNLAGNLAGNCLVSLGKNTLMKQNIDKYSKNPDILYRNMEFKEDGKTKIPVNKDRTRKYFTHDPIQTIQNMFNGGKWLNTYQIPYYGNDYLSAKHSKGWSLAGSERFLGTGLAGDSANKSIGHAPSFGTKRIWY